MTQKWASNHQNLNYRTLTTAPLKRLHIFLTLIILTDAKLLGVACQIKPLQGRKKPRIRVEREQVRNVSVPAVSHTVSKCCSAYVVIVVTSGHYSRWYDCCLLIGRLSVYEILQPAPTTMTRSKSLQSPFFTFWWSLGTRASHVDHVYIPKGIELLPHDWLVWVNERLKVVPNKVANKWTSPFPAASTYWTGEIMRQMSLK